jgi:membrane protease YdiL (CAAX protease family)
VLPDKPWKLEEVARLFLGVITTYCIGMLVANLVVYGATEWPKNHEDAWRMVVKVVPLLQSATDQIKAHSEFSKIMLGALFLEVPALAWIALFLRQRGIGWREAFGLRTSGVVKALSFSFVMAGFFLPAAWLLQSLSEQLMILTHLKPEEQATIQLLENPELGPASKATIFLIAVVFAPVIEECLFRGILYPAMKQRGYGWFAAIGTSLLFAAAHFNMVTFLPLFVLSLLLIYLYEVFQNLLAPMAAHALFNAANFVMLVYNDQINDGINRLLHHT